MKILEYHFRDVGGPGWNFARITFGKINLLVGDTATGKSRLLNTIFNLGRFAVSKEFFGGHWDIMFEHSGATYTWNLQTEQKEIEGVFDSIIKKEDIYKHENGKLIPLVQRNDKTFIFQNKEVPKLSLKETSISLLKEEELIRPLYEAFSIIQRRLFYADALQRVSDLQTIQERQFQKKDLKILFNAGLNLSANLYILSKHFNDTYNVIIEQYKKVFPFVHQTRVTNLTELEPNIRVPGFIPVFSIREPGSDRWIPITELSSGMQKVLLILSDVYILPVGGVYVIDEYENSLGINAIDFFPHFVLDIEKDVQFFVTSHHPYIINEIPPNNWYIFHRDGMNVSIRYGQELVERYGKSKQQAFIQLINDPLSQKGFNEHLPCFRR